MDFPLVVLPGGGGAAPQGAGPEAAGGGGRPRGAEGTEERGIGSRGRGVEGAGGCPWNGFSCKINPENGYHSHKIRLNRHFRKILGGFPNVQKHPTIAFDLRRSGFVARLRRSSKRGTQGSLLSCTRDEWGRRRKDGVASLERRIDPRKQ